MLSGHVLGWLPVAGGLALMWGALLRSGEFLVAKRRQLLLPSDALGTMTWALLSLEEPKTRFSAARHQSAKLDWPDLVELVELAFAHLPPHANLWPQSGQTFRTRFKSLMLAMGLPTEKTPAHRILDLGSMRPGGATHAGKFGDSAPSGTLDVAQSDGNLLAGSVEHPLPQGAQP